MKCVKITDNPKGIIIDEKEVPIPKEFDVVIKLKACGICGSDINNIFYDSCKPSKILGHELAGIIINVGKKVKNLGIGDRVLVQHHCPCEKCQICLKGNETMCEKFNNCVEPCGMSDYFLVNEWIVKQGGIFKIPKWMNFEEAALIEPFACCLRAWKKLNVKQIRSLIIFGVGPIGVMHTILARHFGITDTYCTDVDKFRLKFCKENNLASPISIDFKNYKKVENIISDIAPDLIIIATSDISVIKNAIEIVGKGGIILLFGEPPMFSKIKIDLNKIFSKGVMLLTSYSASNKDISESIKLIEKNHIDLKLLITHRFPLIDVKNALDVLLHKKNVMKVILKQSS